MLCCVSGVLRGALHPGRPVGVSQVSAVALAAGVVPAVSHQDGRLQTDFQEQVVPRVMCSLDPRSALRQRRLSGADREHREYSLCQVSKQSASQCLD